MTDTEFIFDDTEASRFCYHMHAAVGWMELNCPDEAYRELEEFRLVPKCFKQVCVLELRYSIHMQQGNWSCALGVARKLTRHLPKNSQYWIWRATAYRMARSARVAYRSLASQASRLKSADVHYNLACYEAVSRGNTEVISAHLSKAFSRKKSLKFDAVTDPDLADFLKDKPKSKKKHLEIA